MSMQGAGFNQGFAPTLLFNNIQPSPSLMMLAFQDAVASNKLVEIHNLFSNLITEFESKYGAHFIGNLGNYLFEVCKTAVQNCQLETVLRLFNLECQGSCLLKDMNKEFYISLMRLTPNHLVFLYLLLTAPNDLSINDLLPYMDDMTEAQLEAIRENLGQQDLPMLDIEEPEAGNDADVDEDFSDDDENIPRPMQRLR